MGQLLRANLSSCFHFAKIQLIFQLETFIKNFLTIQWDDAANIRFPPTSQSSPRHDHVTNHPTATAPCQGNTARHIAVLLFGCCFTLVSCLFYTFKVGNKCNTTVLPAGRERGGGRGRFGGGDDGQPPPSRAGRHRGWKRAAARCFIIELLTVVQYVAFFSRGYVDNSFSDITKVLCTLAV